MPAYSIAVEDIDNYLATKQDDDVIGITCDGGKCLVAKAFYMKYPGIQVIIDQSGSSVWPDKAIKWESMDLPDEVISIVRNFDYLADVDDYDGTETAERPITKREWLQIYEVSA